jgi:hypothetical protein
VAQHEASGGNPTMDYAEHEATYRVFTSLVKRGTLATAAVVVILAFLTL